MWEHQGYAESIAWDGSSIAVMTKRIEKIVAGDGGNDKCDFCFDYPRFGMHLSCPICDFRMCYLCGFRVVFTPDELTTTTEGWIVPRYKCHRCRKTLHATQFKENYVVLLEQVDELTKYQRVILEF